MKDKEVLSQIDAVVDNVLLPTCKNVEDGCVLQEQYDIFLQNSIDVVRNTMKRDLSFQSFQEINGETKKKDL
jgi:hypothetical protein